MQFMDTVCRPTKDRQSAAVDLARRASVVIVIGGANSNNTHELVNTCSRFCERVHHVQRAGDLTQGTGLHGLPALLEDVAAGPRHPLQLLEMLAGVVVAPAGAFGRRDQTALHVVADGPSRHSREVDQVLDAGGDRRAEVEGRPSVRHGDVIR